MYSGRLFGNYKLGKMWAAQFFGFYRGRQVQLQGMQGGFGIYSLGFRRDLKDKRGSVGIGVENFLARSMKIRNELESPILVQRSVNEMRNFSVRVNFSYRIGKMSYDNQPRRRRRGISNDDLKEGGEGAGQMDTGMQQGQPRGAGVTMPAAPRTTPPVETPAADPEAVVEATGKWEYTVESPQGSNGGIIQINKEDENYTGVLVNARMKQELTLSDVKVNGNELSFSYTMNFGGNEVVIDVKGIIEGDEMKGNMNVGQFRSMPFTAKRSAE